LIFANISNCSARLVIFSLIKLENNTKYLIVYLSPRFIVNNYQFI